MNFFVSFVLYLHVAYQWQRLLSFYVVLQIVQLDLDNQDFPLVPMYFLHWNILSILENIQPNNI